LLQEQDSKNYWSVEPMLSHNMKYLWATARAEPNTNLTGWISGFQLDSDGRIRKQLFMIPTTTINGIANAVSPAPFSDEWMALTDDPTGFVQIWRLKNMLNGTTTVPVVKVDISDGGCCANAIWYD
jgi:carboxy-cis,cis-muconate cyclase